jgi:transcriptional regulator with XRE-family HTH domain
MTFGRELTRALNESGMTQKELSDAMGGLAAQSTISEWKSGKSEPESPQVTFELERALGVEPGRLSAPLGYIPSTSARGLEVTILSSPEIDENWRQVLLALLRQIGRQRNG